MVDIDIDIWRDGRDADGKYVEALMKANYSHIAPRTTEEYNKVRDIIAEHIDPKMNGLRPYRTTSFGIFFEDSEDAEFVRALLYVY